MNLLNEGKDKFGFLGATMLGIS